MKNKYVTESLLFLLYMAFGISWFAFSPVLPELRAYYHISGKMGGSLSSVVSLAKTFVPILAGVLGARFGIKITLAVGAGLSAFALLFPFAHTFTQLLFLRFLFGIGGAIIVTLMGACVAEIFSKKELPLVNAFNNVAVNTGITVSIFLTPVLLLVMSWKKAFLLYGFLNLLLLVLWLILGAGGHSRPAGEKARDQASLWDVLRMRETWLLGLAFTGPLSFYLALNTWLPSYYQEAHNFSRQAASGYTALMNFAGIPVAVLGGFLASRLGVRRPLMIFPGIFMALSGLGMVLLTDPFFIKICALVLGSSFFLYVSPMFTLPVELPGMNPKKVGLLLGVVFSLAYSTSFFSPILVGWTKDAMGSYLPGLLICSLLSLFLSVGGYFLPETGPGRQRKILRPSPELCRSSSTCRVS